jgi:FkbM family methyltransferase
MQMIDTYESVAELRNRFYKLTGRSFKNIAQKIVCHSPGYIKLLLMRRGLMSSSVRSRFFIGEYGIYLDVLDGNNQNIFLFGILSKKEDALTKYLIKNISEKDVFFDIGASYGFYTMLAANLAKDGSVYAFEPNKKVFSYLSKTCENINKSGGQVFPKQVAISNVVEKVEFYDLYSSNQSSVSTLVKDTLEKESDYESYMVQSVNLDSFLSDAKITPTIVKVDIESGEKAFIEGANNFLKTSSPKTILELKFNSENDRINSQECIKLMNSLLYSGFRILDDGSLEVLSEKYLSSTECHSRSYENFVFIKPSDVDTNISS